MGIDLESFIALKQPYETVKVEVLRGGMVSILTVRIDNMDKRQLGKDYPSPSYFIYGGIVFVNTKQQGVKIAQVLEDDINMGYTSFMGEFVDSVNGQQVSTVEEFKEEIESPKDWSKHVRIELQSLDVIILNLESVEKAQAHILKTHHIPSQMSQDLVKIEEKKLKK